jgi:hypothetical protein
MIKAGALHAENDGPTIPLLIYSLIISCMVSLLILFMEKDGTFTTPLFVGISAK